jgi:hypothetical protein
LEAQFARAGKILTLDLLVEDLRRFDQAVTELQQEVRDLEAEILEEWLELT